MAYTKKGPWTDVLDPNDPPPDAVAVDAAFLNDLEDWAESVDAALDGSSPGSGIEPRFTYRTTNASGGSDYAIPGGIEHGLIDGANLVLTVTAREGDAIEAACAFMLKGSSAAHLDFAIVKAGAIHRRFFPGSHAVGAFYVERANDPVCPTLMTKVQANDIVNGQVSVALVGFVASGSNQIWCTEAYGVYFSVANVWQA
jgi:hypothetical protein